MPVNETLDCIVGELAAPIKNALVGGPFGSDLVSADYVQSGIPVIRGQNLKDKYVSGEFVFVSQAKAQKLAANMARPGDLVFTQRGNAVLHGGQVAIVPDRPFERYLVSQSQMKLTPDPAKVDARFLYFVFTSSDYRHYLRSNAIVTGVPHINLGLLRDYRLSLPPLAEQNAIAEILGALDDKIVLNRRMNETLEAVAQALFQNWFVDSTQDALPEGWREGTLGEVADNPRRGVHPESIEPTTPYIGLEHMPRRRIALTDWGHADELASNKFAFKRGEVLFGKLRPYFHKVGVAPVDGVCSTDILVVSPKELAWFGFVLGHISSVELVNHADAGSTGTKMPRTNWNYIARFEVAIPPTEVAGTFTALVRPLVDRIISNTHESRTLATLRDALLPKLLSGELRVPAAAKLVEDA